jgi:hypothetical protein
MAVTSEWLGAGDSMFPASVLHTLQMGSRSRVSRVSTEFDASCKGIVASKERPRP